MTALSGESVTRKRGPFSKSAVLPKRLENCGPPLSLREMPAEERKKTRDVRGKR